MKNSLTVQFSLSVNNKTEEKQLYISNGHYVGYWQQCGHSSYWNKCVLKAFVHLGLAKYTIQTHSILLKWRSQKAVNPKPKNLFKSHNLLEYEKSFLFNKNIPIMQAEYSSLTKFYLLYYRL